MMTLEIRIRDILQKYPTVTSRLDISTEALRIDFLSNDYVEESYGSKKWQICMIKGAMIALEFDLDSTLMYNGMKTFTGIPTMVWQDVMVWDSEVTVLCENWDDVYEALKVLDPKQRGT